MLGLSALVGALLTGATLVVAPTGPYQTIPEALAAARAGDTIEVHGGVHPGPLVIDRPVALVGIDNPVLDGGGRGTVVTLAAPGTTLRGFEVRASGSELNTSDAGIQVQAAAATVADNHLDDVLFGISLDNAPSSVIRGNTVRGKDLPVAQRGDGIRLWYSSDVLVQDNRVEAGRDCVIWYSSAVQVLGNTIEDGRYGLHFMYNDGALVAGNVLRRNSVGAYMMYSRGLTVRGNLVASNRGPSGLGLGLKDVDNLVAEDNWIVDNRGGIYIDNSPTSLDAESRFTRNMIAFNDIGLMLLPNVERNTYWDNAFQENLQQVSLQGGGTLRNDHWTRDGRGNFWSDYRGFDADGDGRGDLPYRAEGLFADLMDRLPQTRIFQFSLASGALEFAAQAFPGLRPAPKVVDEAPLLSPPAIPTPPGLPSANSWPGLGLALGLLGAAGSVLGLSRVRPRKRVVPAVAVGSGPALQIAGLTKSFGRVTVVDGLDLAVAPGEAVALWGPNGAGKTTAIRCILGLLPCQGEIRVAGRDAIRSGKEARRALGYVPQEMALHPDLTVAETITFYARLRRAPRERGLELLALLGLDADAGKKVGALSGGQRQRLGLVLALLADPPLLLLDEPTSNLDARARDQVLRLLVELRRRGTAILFASHRLEEVETLASRVLVLERGRVTDACRPHELARRLGLRLSIRLRVAKDARDDAVSALLAGGLAPNPNGSSIAVEVLATEKVVPIRLLERAGIIVTDFTIEDGASGLQRGAE